MKAPAILVTVPFNSRHLARLREAAGPTATVTQVISPDRDTLRALLREADAVVGEPAPDLLDEGARVRWIQMTWAGTDLYTSGPVTLPGHVRLTNVAGGAYGHTISQYVVGQILALMQNLPTYVRQQERALWADVGRVATLEGATVLVFGTGDIGQCTAKRLGGFDTAQIVGVCRNTGTPRAGFDALVTLEEAEGWLARSDVVVNCLPNTPQTAGYLDEKRLRLMGDDSVLVNVGRGTFIDCDALARVLAEGRLRGAALDVTNPEPLPPDHALWREPRCVITPHASGGAFGKSDGTEERICAIVCENLRRFVAGEELTHVVL